MPAIGNIVVADNTPANHTLEPISASVALSSWAQTDASVFDGNKRLAVSMSLPNAARKTFRTKHVLTVPVIEVVDGVDKVVDTMIFTIESVVPQTVSAANALHGYKMLDSYVGGATCQAYIAGRSPVY